MEHGEHGASDHVLLIGIDGYARRTLHGAINDIEAIQRVLVERVGVAVSRITRLASPGTGPAPHPATAAAIRAALDQLVDRVAPGDRVVIYIAGHGTRVRTVAPDGHARWRDALAPVDAFHAPDDPRVIFDVELDARFAAIAARTPNLTVIFDGCHAAGALRPGLEPPSDRARYLRPPDGTVVAEPELAARPRAIAYQRIAACQPHERAIERHDHGACHGVLTRALLRALDAVPGALAAVTWNQIWNAVRADIEDRQPWQHARLAGQLARGVFGGVPVDASAGLSVIRTGVARYRIAAGTLAGVTEGATVALYRDRPRPFARLDSPDDVAARIGGLLRVESATRGAAIAVPIAPAADADTELDDDTEPTALERPGARGRVIAAGAPVRLRCALIPDDAALAAALAASPLLEVVEPARADVQLVLAGGRWFVTDDVHGAAAGDPVLIALGPHDLGHARRVLEHYHAYAAARRIAARAIELPGGLELTAHVAPAQPPSPAEALDARWPTLAELAPGRVAAAPDTHYCVRVHNTSDTRLRVTLLVATSTGKVQLLGDQVIDAGTAFVFWRHNHAGTPFAVSAPGGRARTADRVIAIGRAAMAIDIGYLRLDAGFGDVLHPARNRDRPDSATHKAVPAPEPWTAAQLVLDIRDLAECGDAERRDGLL